MSEALVRHVHVHLFDMSNTGNPAVFFETARYAGDARSSRAASVHPRHRKENRLVSVPNLSAKTMKLSIRNFAHLKEVDLTFGDLTVLVGPQGAGKSLALQWLKVAMDGRQLVDALRAAGHPTERPDVLVDLIFGTGMAAAWKDGKTEVTFGRRRLLPKTFSRIGDGEERLFFVPRTVRC
jgi:hypothetical protein